MSKEEKEQSKEFYLKLLEEIIEKARKRGGYINELESELIDRLLAKFDQSK